MVFDTSALYKSTMDARLARVVGHSEVGDSNGEAGKAVILGIMPYSPPDQSFISDLYETPGSIDNRIAELQEDNAQLNKFIQSADGSGRGDRDVITNQIEALKKKQEALNNIYTDLNDNYLAPHALVHPYALIKLAGACGKSYAKRTKPNADTSPLVDVAGYRRYYEIDGDEYGGYAKVPTTTRIIKWGMEDSRSRFPYSFQDFVFCKQWNKIPNNRLITLRRYCAPVTDNVVPSDFEGKGDNLKVSNNTFAPVATALTYFGEGTDNSLSDIMNFSFHYNWKELHAETTPIDVSSTQNDEGDVLGSSTGIGRTLSSGLRMFSHALGFFNDMEGKGVSPRFAANNVPPDPYNNGPYENRILGPINVIMDTYARDRGLKFTHDNIKINFDYVSRPISGINNKAILLDLLSNIMLMTYASGTWFGGMWRYRCEKPASYPWQDGMTMNKLYQGKIFGKDGAAGSLIKNAWSAHGAFIMGVLGDLADMIKSVYGKLMGGMLNAVGMGDGSSGDNDKDDKKDKKSDSIIMQEEDDSINRGTKAGKSVLGAVEKMIARRALKGATVPYLENQKALLTGDVVGEWHLTIGNPLNPIAHIGNLIVTNASIKFSDELGPDDFPIGFRATIELKHALGRDRDAIESMFNRGTGRLYTLSKKLRTSADCETKVDEHTGVSAKQGVRSTYEETFATHWGGGFRYIAKTQNLKLNNTGSAWVAHNAYNALQPSQDNEYRGVATYALNPWQTAINL